MTIPKCVGHVHVHASTHVHMCICKKLYSSMHNCIGLNPTALKIWTVPQRKWDICFKASNNYGSMLSPR